VLGCQANSGSAADRLGHRGVVGRPGETAGRVEHPGEQAGLRGSGAHLETEGRISCTGRLGDLSRRQRLSGARGEIDGLQVRRPRPKPSAMAWWTTTIMISAF
jgi:hypothetical protein